MTFQFFTPLCLCNLFVNYVKIMIKNIWIIGRSSIIFCHHIIGRNSMREENSDNLRIGDMSLAPGRQCCQILIAHLKKLKCKIFQSVCPFLVSFFLHTFFLLHKKTKPQVFKKSYFFFLQLHKFFALFLSINTQFFSSSTDTC